MTAIVKRELCAIRYGMNLRGAEVITQGQRRHGLGLPREEGDTKCASVPEEGWVDTEDSLQEKGLKKQQCLQGQVQ